MVAFCRVRTRRPQPVEGRQRPLPHLPFQGAGGFGSEPGNGVLIIWTRWPNRFRPRPELLDEVTEALRFVLKPEDL